VKSATSDEKTEVPVATLTLPADVQLPPMVSVSPSFAPVGKRLVFALNSMEVKNELKRVYGGEGEPIDSGKNPLHRQRLCAAGGRELGARHGLGQAPRGRAQHREELRKHEPRHAALRSAKLPPGEIFTDHFKPTFYYSKPVSGGMYRRNEASFGAESWLGIVGTFVGAAALRPSGGMAPVQIDTAPEPARRAPAGSRDPRPMARADRRRRVRRLRRRLGAYLLPRVGPPLLRALVAQLEGRRARSEHWDEVWGQPGMLATLWHGRMVVPITAQAGRKICVLVSPSADGQLVPPILKQFGYDWVLGSSNKNPRAPCARCSSA
jgi:hypothetical protein